MPLMMSLNERMTSYVFRVGMFDDVVEHSFACVRLCLYLWFLFVNNAECVCGSLFR